eukprot:366226-Chlamydomonas_euryale.AAC.23
MHIHIRRARSMSESVTSSSCMHWSTPASAATASVACWTHLEDVAAREVLRCSAPLGHAAGTLQRLHLFQDALGELKLLRGAWTGRWQLKTRWHACMVVHVLNDGAHVTALACISEHHGHGTSCSPPPPHPPLSRPLAPPEAHDRATRLPSLLATSLRHRLTMDGGTLA